MSDPVSDETLRAARAYVLECLDRLCVEMVERRPDLFPDMSFGGVFSMLMMCASYRAGEACADPSATETVRQDRLHRLMTFSKNSHARGYADRMEEIRKEHPHV